MTSLQTTLSSENESVKKTTLSENMESKIFVTSQPHGDKIINEEKSNQDKIGQALQQELQDIGPIKSSEIIVALSFILLILLLFTKSPKFAPGWSSVLKGCLNTYEGPCKDEDLVTVGSVVPAVAIVIMIFILPKTWTFWPFTSLKNSKSSDGLVNWITIEKKMPWGVMILLGGGFTLSYGCNKSGLSQWIGKKHAFIKMREDQSTN